MTAEGAIREGAAPPRVNADDVRSAARRRTRIVFGEGLRPVEAIAKQLT